MATSNLFFVNTAKTTTHYHYEGIPTSKTLAKTRLFADDLLEPLVAGMELYRTFSKFVDTKVAWVDRTATLTTPFNVALHPSLIMPAFERVAYTYDECCDWRAKELLENGRHILVFYGGGIDSITMLTALLRNKTDQKISVVMSDDSIKKNITFYRNYILGKVDIIPSHKFTEYLGHDQYLCVFGGNNDELFGTNFIPNLVRKHGESILWEDVSDLLIEKISFPDIPEEDDIIYHEENGKCVDLMLQVIDTSPVLIDNVYEFYWWINMCLKWNVTNTRYIGFNQHNREQLRIGENYVDFFNTPEFQLWSMNNKSFLSPDKLQAKQYIMSSGVDANIEKQTKSSGLNKFCYNKPMAFAIDEEYNYYDNVERTIDFINIDNSFNK